MSYTNCIFFALALYFGRWRKGRSRYLVWRRSHWGPFPHCLFGRGRRNGTIAVVSYVPRDPRDKLVPPPCFVGRVRWGDE